MVLGTRATISPSKGETAVSRQDEPHLRRFPSPTFSGADVPIFVSFFSLESGACQVRRFPFPFSVVLPFDSRRGFSSRPAGVTRRKCTVAGCQLSGSVLLLKICRFSLQPSKASGLTAQPAGMRICFSAVQSLKAYSPTDVQPSGTYTLSALIPWKA